MCGSPDISFPSPNEVGAAQFAWNNFNQITPYGSVSYTAPTFDASGNPISPGTMTQELDPQLLALQEAMMGLRGNALGRLGSMFGGGGFGPGNFNFNNPEVPFNPWSYPRWDYDGGNYPAGDPGAGGGVDPGLVNPKSTGGYNPNQQQGQPPPGSPGAPSPPVADTPPHRYGGSDIMGGSDILNPLFYSNSAPALKFGLNMGNLPGLLGEGDLLGERQRVEQGMYDRAMGLLDPQFQQQTASFEQEMANRGIPVGSEEYNERYQLLQQSQNNARQAAAQDAIGAGREDLLALAGLSGQQRGQKFGEQLSQIGVSNQARQQAFGETMGVRDALLRSVLGLGQFGLQQQGQEFGQLASLLGLSQPPGAGGDLSQFYGPSPVDMMQAYGMNQQGQMYNAGNNISGAGLMAGLFGLGGAAMGAPGFWG